MVSSASSFHPLEAARVRNLRAKSFTEHFPVVNGIVVHLLGNLLLRAFENFPEVGLRGILVLGKNIGIYFISNILIYLLYLISLLQYLDFAYFGTGYEVHHTKWQCANQTDQQM